MRKAIFKVWCKFCGYSIKINFLNIKFVFGWNAYTNCFFLCEKNFTITWTQQQISTAIIWVLFWRIGPIFTCIAHNACTFISGQSCEQKETFWLMSTHACQNYELFWIIEDFKRNEIDGARSHFAVICVNEFRPKASVFFRGSIQMFFVKTFAFVFGRYRLNTLGQCYIVIDWVQNYWHFKI